MDKTKNWLSMRSTQLGIAGAIIAIIGEFYPEMLSLAVTILSGFGLVLPDRKNKEQ